MVLLKYHAGLKKVFPGKNRFNQQTDFGPSIRVAKLPLSSVHLPFYRVFLFLMVTV